MESDSETEKITAMLLLQRIKTGIPEFGEQAAIVAESYGGSKIRWMFSIAWCLVRYGARPIDYVRFGFHKKSARERNRFLTIYRYFRVIRHFGYGLDRVKGKIAEYHTFKDYIRRDWMEVSARTNADLIRCFIEKHGIVFAKQDNGDQGKGVIKIDGVDSEAYAQLLSERERIDFVLEEVVNNCKELADINSSSLNTVRATTLIKKDGTPTIVSIILRVGASGSHVDNWGAGGIGYNFDLETGVCNMYGRDKKNRPYVSHPGSNVQMIGFQLPYFDELKKYVLELAMVYPKARYVGWDIAITSNGFDLIEMNCPAGHDMFQSFDNPIYELMKKEW